MRNPAVCVVMQPAYLPWPGYFNLICESDVFVFLDDVQFEKQSWQSRNKVLVSGEAKWLSIPMRNAPLATALRDVLVAEDPRWRRKHARTLEQSYRRHPFFADIQDVIDIIETHPSSGLVSLTTAIIRQLSTQLALKPRFEVASSLGILGTRSERLVSICKRFSCRQYLSPAGSADYLTADGAFGRSDIVLRLQQFSSRPYPQKGSESFVGYLSILDILANLGTHATREYIGASGGLNEVV